MSKSKKPISEEQKRINELGHSVAFEIEMEKQRKRMRIYRKYEIIDKIFRNFYFRILTLILMGFTVFNTLHITLGVL